MRPLATLLALVVPVLALADPVPRPRTWLFAPGLDRPIDPDRDCKFTFGKGTLTIEVPGKAHDFDPARDRFNAPRILCPVDGDFRVESRVRGDFPLSETSTVAGVPARAGGGLIVMANEKRGQSLRLEFGVTRDRKGAPRRYVWIKDSLSGKAVRLMGHDEKGAGWHYPAGATYAYLKLELRHREGTCELAVSDSHDGKKWTVWDSLKYIPFSGVPKKALVGVAASSSSTRPCKVTFDQFKLTRLPAEMVPGQKGDKP